MTFSRTRIVTCFFAFAVAAGGVTACASVIGIGDPALDTEGVGTLPADAATAEASPAKDTGPSVDSAPVPAPDAGQVFCGAKTCPLATTVCCTYEQSQSPPPYKSECAKKCRPPDSGEPFVVTLKCARAADCPGQKCCLRTSSSSSTGTATCEASCSGSSGTYTMCNPDGPNTCGGDSCTPFMSNIPSTYGFCDGS